MRVLNMRIAYQCLQRLEFLHFLYLISYSCNSLRLLYLHNRARRGDMFMYSLPIFPRVSRMRIERGNLFSETRDDLRRSSHLLLSNRLVERNDLAALNVKISGTTNVERAVNYVCRRHRITLDCNLNDEADPF